MNLSRHAHEADLALTRVSGMISSRQYDVQLCDTSSSGDSACSFERPLRHARLADNDTLELEAAAMISCQLAVTGTRSASSFFSFALRFFASTDAFTGRRRRTSSAHATSAAPTQPSLVVDPPVMLMLGIFSESESVTCT